MNTTSSKSSDAVATTSLVVVAGGVRSGKSRFALDLALRQGPRRCFVATARVSDDEMRRRIERHQHERTGAFTTVEAPVELEAVARRMPIADVVLVDCLTLYVSNLLLQLGDVDQMPEAELELWEERARLDVQKSVHQLRQKAECVVLVTNEVGMGVVPVSRLGRVFRDVAGRVNQWVAGEADQVWLCALGIPLQIKPAFHPLTSGFASSGVC